MNPCPGPLIWFPCEGGAVLECATCGHVTVTGNFNDATHAGTDLIREGV